MFSLQQQYAVLKPANSYTGGGGWRFCRVGVVHLVYWTCVLRATTKKGRQLFCIALKYFPLEPPVTQLYGPTLRRCVLTVSLDFSTV